MTFYLVSHPFLGVTQIVRFYDHNKPLMAQEFWIFLISGLALLIFALAWLVIMLISKFLTKIVYSYPSQNHTDTAIQCTISLRYGGIHKLH